MNGDWVTVPLEDVCDIEYGTRVVKKRDAGTLYPVYGGGGATFFVDQYNREDCTIVSRFGMSEECVRHVCGRFFLNDSGLSVSPKDQKRLAKRLLDYLLLANGCKIYRLGRGAAQKNLDVNLFRKILVSFPVSVEDQERMVAIFDEAFEGIGTVVANTEKNLANAREIFESYLDRIFREFESDWCEAPIFEHVSFIDYRGKTPKKTDDGVRLITAKNVRMGSLRREPEEFIHPDDYDSWMTRGFPKKGDVLFTTEAPLGLVCQLDTDERVALAQRIITMQPVQNVISPEYLSYVLRCRLVQGRIHSNATGATASGIKASVVSHKLAP